MSRTYDLVSLGEPLLRLSPPGSGQLRRARSLDAVVVGSQLNVAADLARLGRRTAFLSKVPDHALGDLVRDTVAGYGVDTSYILASDGGKLGVTYVEFSAAPRPPVAVYDRAGSAAAGITAADFDWDAILGASAMAYCDGIFPGLGDGCRRATEAFLTAARRQGSTAAFDLNYRAHLWTPHAARDAWGALLAYVDVLVTNRNASEAVFGYTGSDEEIARAYIDRFGCRVVCLTSREMDGLRRGAWNSRAFCADGESYEAKRIEFEIVDRYGTGDAWCAGFLYGYAERGPAYGLAFGNALCALAHTIEGDVAHVSPADVERLMTNGRDIGVKR